ncbi:MAG: hypothetical protein ACE15B_06460 [Bryobacteraceae bacterium]
MSPRLFALLLAVPALAETVPYFRLRVEYATTSDWTTLEPVQADSFLSVRQMSTFGNFTRADARVNLLALNQPLASARGGDSVGMTADFALSPPAGPLEFVLKKGAVGASTVRLYLVEEAGTKAVAGIGHDGAVPGDTATNTLRFTVSLPEDAQPRWFERPDRPKMVWAFYYPWYRLRDWASPQLKDRPLQPYSSDDPEAIARHVEQAREAGIDGFISSWWGPGHYTDQNLALLLEIAAGRGFAVTIYFETLASSGARSPAEIRAWLAYFLERYGGHPALYKVDGKPLVAIWASATVPLDTWREIFASLRAEGLDACYLAGNLDTKNLAVFDGLHTYSVFNTKDLPATLAAAGRAVRYYPLLMDAPAPRIWAATAQPGYDERLIPGRAGLYREREDGAFYRSTLDAALASGPDWLFLTSWNEWWEHTHIEPSEAHLGQYLSITREYAGKLKARP